MKAPQLLKHMLRIQENMPFVSVIIPVYNDAERVKICLQALENQTYPTDAFEVIVVDNGSQEKIELARTVNPQIRLCVEQQPGSYAARNKGITLARGDVLAFTDSDCIPALDWIERGVAALQLKPDCGFVGGKIEMFFQDPECPTAVELYDAMTYLNQRNHVEKNDFSATANLLTYKRIVEHVGPFVSALKAGGDKEWGQRVVTYGYRAVYADDVSVAHPARYSLSRLLVKERRVAKGSLDAQAFRKKRAQKSAPFTWSFDSIMEHCPPLPPVIKIMRFRNVSIRKKFCAICLWFLVRSIKIYEKMRRKLGETGGKE